MGARTKNRRRADVADPKGLAAAVGVTARTLRRWRREPDFPGGELGPWDPDAVSAWSESRRSRRANREPAPDGLALTATERNGPDTGEPTGDPDVRRWRKARADMAELELAKARGDVVDRAELDQQDAEQMGILREWLIKIAPRRHHPTNPKRQQDLRMLLNECLEAIAGWRLDFADPAAPLTDAAPPETHAAETERQRNSKAFP